MTDDLRDERAPHTFTAAPDPLYREVAGDLGYGSRGPLTAALPVVSTAEVIEP